jgi:O-antigen ligase
MYASALSNTSVDFWAQFYGVMGRNNGLLTWSSLFLLFVIASTTSQKNYGYFFRSLKFVCLLNFAYAILQWKNLDPLKWSFNDTIGTLGNSNFLTSLLAFGAILALSQTVNTKWNFAVLPNFVLIFAVFFVGYISSSIMGIGMFLAGAIPIVYARFIKTKTKVLNISFLIASGVFGLTSAIGILQMGPMKKVFNQDSILDRIDYWKAANSVIASNPLNGIGFETFGNWFQRYMSSDMVARRGPKVRTDSSHNLVLDFGLSGGYLLLIFVLIFLVVITSLCVRILIKMEKFESDLASLTAVWFAYVLHSLISVPNIVISFWGWLTAGYILQISIKSKIDSGKKKIPTHLSPIGTFVGLSGVLLSFVLIFFPLNQALKYCSGFNQRDSFAVEKSAREFPKDPFIMSASAEILLKLGQNERSLVLVNELLDRFPTSLSGWQILSLNPNLSPTQRSEALNRIKFLNPHL